MIVFRRWAGTSYSRISTFLRRNKWIFFSFLLATLGVIDTFHPLLPQVAYALAVISLVMLGIDVYRSHRLRHQLEFPKRENDRFMDVKEALQGSTRFEFIRLANGRAVIDRVATTEIREGKVLAQLSSRDYSTPIELKAMGAEFRSRRLKRGATYNGHVLGLSTNIGESEQLAKTDWTLTPARYWDHLDTDIMAMHYPVRAGIIQPGYGRKLVVDNKNKLRDFGDSWLLNAIGTSLIAITSDKKIVVVLQSDRNESSGNHLAPSSSGSLEKKDFQGQAQLSLTKAAINGALRELKHETGILPVDIEETTFLGFARWLDKSAKPELLSLAFLKIDSHEVLRRKPHLEDRIYTKLVRTHRLPDDISDWNETTLANAIDDEASKTGAIGISVPLEICLREMRRAANEPTSPVGDLIRKHFPTNHKNS